MAKVKLNPMFESLSGALGNIVHYRRWKRQYARIYVNPSNPDTAAQRANRNLFAEAMKSWQALPEENKDRYRARARKLPMYGHNLYISEYMKSDSTDNNTASHSWVKQVRTAGRLYSPPVQQASRSVTAPYMIKDQMYSAINTVRNSYG